MQLRATHVRSIVSVITLAALAASGAAAAAAAPGADLPLRAAGDVFSIKLDFLGRFPQQSDVKAVESVRFTQTGARSATIAVQNGSAAGKTSDVAIDGDGRLSDSSAGGNDFASDYNAIVTAVSGINQHLTSRHAIWDTTLPAKISPTEWKPVPVRLTADRQGSDTIVVDGSGTKSFPLFGNGFTSAGDVSVTYRAEFRRGHLTSARFSMHEVVHAQIDIPVSYEWAMSLQT